MTGATRVEPHELERILERLDREYEEARIPCAQRLAFVLLQGLVCAAPLLAAAALSARLLPDQSQAFAAVLKTLLFYSLVLAVVLLPPNFRLVDRAMRHYRLTRSLEAFDLADYLWGKRGRPESSPDAHRAKVTGAPVLLCLFFLLTLVLGGWGQREWWEVTAAAGACLALFWVMPACDRLLEHLSRRVDSYRELQMLRRELGRRAREADGSPVVLKREVALRLSDADRMFVLRQRAEAVHRFSEGAGLGWVLVMHGEARSQARRLTPEERPKVNEVLEAMTIDPERQHPGGGEAARLRTPVPATALEVVFSLDRTSRRVEVHSVGAASAGGPDAKAGAD